MSTVTHSGYGKEATVQVPQKQKLVFRLGDAPLRAMPNDKFRDFFAITDDGCGPATQISAGMVWFKPGNTEGHLDRHDVDEAFYVISGKAVYHANEERISVQTGDIIYCPAGLEHTFYTQDEKFVIFWLIAGQWSTTLAKIKEEVKGWTEVDPLTGWHVE